MLIRIFFKIELGSNFLGFNTSRSKLLIAEEVSRVKCIERRVLAMGASCCVFVYHDLAFNLSLRVHRSCTRHQMSPLKKKLLFIHFTYQEGNTKENSDSSTEVIGDAAKGVRTNQQSRQV